MAVEKIDLNNLDKSDWQIYRFDEIAQNISERVDPNNTDLEVYIGLEQTLMLLTPNYFHFLCILICL